MLVRNHPPEKWTCWPHFFTIANGRLRYGQARFVYNNKCHSVKYWFFSGFQTVWKGNSNMVPVSLWALVFYNNILISARVLNEWQDCVRRSSGQWYVIASSVVWCNIYSPRDCGITACILQLFCVTELIKWDIRTKICLKCRIIYYF